MSDDDYNTVERQKQFRYKKKCDRMKKLIKGLVYENAALCDEIASTQDMLLIFKEERKNLLIREIECEKIEEQKVMKPSTKVKKRKSS